MAVGEARSTRSGRGGAVRFEASRCLLISTHADVAILELEGAFHAGARRSVGRPRLVVRSGGASAEAKAVEAQSAYAAPEPRAWHASFAVPRALAEAGDATFALAVGKSLVLDLPTPDRRQPPEPQDEVEGLTWGSMVVDLSEARRELEGAREELAHANEELARLRAAGEQRADQPEEERPRVTWLEEVEAEASASTNGAAERDDADHESEHEEDTLPVLAGRRRVVPPTTMEHDAVYEATLKRVQVERRARLRRRRILGRMLALVFFLATAVAIYVIVDGDVGIDILQFV
jgi:hypothetical protein